MNRLIAALGVISALSMAGCMAAGPDEELSADALRNGKACTHTGMCGDEEYCSVEDGDCFSNCPPGMVCPAVCSGICVPNATAIRAEPAPGDGEIGDRERGCFSS